MQRGSTPRLVFFLFPPQPIEIDKHAKQGHSIDFDAPTIAFIERGRRLGYRIIWPNRSRCCGAKEGWWSDRLQLTHQGSVFRPPAAAWLARGDGTGGALGLPGRANRPHHARPWLGGLGP